MSSLFFLDLFCRSINLSFCFILHSKLFLLIHANPLQYCYFLNPPSACPAKPSSLPRSLSFSSSTSSLSHFKQTPTRYTLVPSFPYLYLSYHLSPSTLSTQTCTLPYSLFLSLLFPLTYSLSRPSLSHTMRA